MRLRAFILMFPWWIFSQEPIHAAVPVPPGFGDYEYLVTEDNAFGLYKPKGWKVNTQTFPNGRMVFAVSTRCGYRTM